MYLFFIVLSVGSISTGGVLRALSPETGSTSVAVMGRQLYEEMRLDQWVCFDAFMQGLRGSEKIDRKNKDILTLIDFSKPSTAERMVVLDIRQREYFTPLWFLTVRIAEGIMRPLSRTRTVLIKAL